MLAHRVVSLVPLGKSPSLAEQTVVRLGRQVVGSVGATPRSAAVPLTSRPSSEWRWVEAPRTCSSPAGLAPGTGNGMVVDGQAAATMSPTPPIGTSRDVSKPSSTGLSRPPGRDIPSDSDATNGREGISWHA